ncbi:MAG TPA: pyrroline-5-carboxylate reductase [Arenimonas sp.]|nr:pyrroline-5-carboxylate reductase [Arenimonas sp.]
MKTNIAFIGGGNMARSIIGGLLANGYENARIHVSEPYQPVREALANELALDVVDDNLKVATKSQVWLFAVKPQVMKAVCAELKALAQTQKPLIISIAAGITATQLDEWLGGSAAIVRVMPNTPALLGAGASGLFATNTVNDEQKQTAELIFQATGLIQWIDEESLIDTVTALSGSGPAYVFMLAEAMQAAAEKQGLPKATAQALAVQTFVGAAKMLSESGESAEILRQRVTSPNGTTHAAIVQFEQGGLRELVQSAMDAASERGRALSKEND